MSIYAFVVLPRVGPWPPSHFYDYPFAHGPAALLLAPLLHPLAFGAAIFTVGRLTYVLEALIPLAFVPLRTRVAWLAVPGFAIVLLANSGLVWRMGMHYAALWIPWLLIAFAAGIATLRNQRRWTTVAFVLSAIVLIAFSPLHPLHYLKPSYHALGDAREVLASIPQRRARRDARRVVYGDRRRGTRTRSCSAPVRSRSRAPYIVFADDFPNEDFQKRLLPQIRSALQAVATHSSHARRGVRWAAVRTPRWKAQRRVPWPGRTARPFVTPRIESEGEPL